MAAHALLPVELIDLAPGTRLGNWTVVARLGWGGYGAVYLVKGLRWPWRQAALKLALEPGPVARRLVREKELLARVRHARVVRLLDSGEWLPPGRREPLPFLVMKYVPGTNLYAWAWQRNPWVDEMVGHFRDSAWALHAVHEAGAVHRDVKGENLLVGADGKLMLVDLGAGYYEGAEALTEGPMPPGTRSYRSPEALRFRDARDFEERYKFRPADDLYALGVTWYRALTDELPFEAEGSEKARREGRLPVAPGELNPPSPTGLGRTAFAVAAEAQGRGGRRAGGRTRRRPLAAFKRYDTGRQCHARFEASPSGKESPPVAAVPGDGLGLRQRAGDARLAKGLSSRGARRDEGGGLRAGRVGLHPAGHPPAGCIQRAGHLP